MNDRRFVRWRYAGPLAALALTPRLAEAGALALSPERLAVGGSETVVIYAMPGGAVVAELPVVARSAQWEGDRLEVRLRRAVASWSPSDGLQISADVPSGDDWILGPRGLIYDWDTGKGPWSVSVMDPWTGLRAIVAQSGTHINRAGPDGYIDAMGLHSFDGRLVVAVGEGDIMGLQNCTVAAGPRMLCRRSGTATLRGGHTAATWRTTAGSIEAVLQDGPSAGTLLVRSAGAKAEWRMVKPDGSVAATFPSATGAWELSEAGLVHAASEHVDVYDLDGALQISIPTPPSTELTLPALSEPALVRSDSSVTRLIATDDGEPLRLVGGPLGSSTVWADAGGLHLALQRAVHTPPPRFHKFNDTTWIYEADGTSTTTTLKKAGVEGDVCGDSLALVTPTGSVDAYSLKGVRRWSVPFAEPPDLEACKQGAWLVTHGDDWSVLEPNRGKAVMHGVGEPDAAFLPDAVLVPKTRTVTLGSGSFVLPEGYRMRLLLPAVGALPVGVLAERAGVVARIDSAGIRWLVHLSSSALLSDASRIYFATTEGTVALDAATGALVWAAPGGDGTATLQLVVPAR